MEDLLQINIFNNTQEQLLFLEQFKVILKQKVIKLDRNKRLKFTQAFCTALLNEYWIQVNKNSKSNWHIISSPCSNTNLDKKSFEIAVNTGIKLTAIDKAEAGNFIGTLYATLLPDDIRSDFGVYYTPPILVDRLIQITSDSGFDWTEGKILDPACGGAAFLAPIANKIIQSFQAKGIENPSVIFRHIQKNLRGIEIDPFAAWISTVLLEIMLLDLCLQVKKRLTGLVTVTDTLKADVSKLEKFDLIIGNPPYGRLTLSEELRSKFKKSLYGHANLYGVFTDIAMQLLNTNGLIAYVTPTSFLGGQYFKSLRKLLGETCPPVTIDFLDQRSGVFDTVLQETVLAVYKQKNEKVPKTVINSISLSKKNKKIKVEHVGSFTLPEVAEDPWIFPRSLLQKAVLGKAITMNCRLKDYGYLVNTGQLVWNRHKDQLKETKTKSSLPIVWAESILPNGIFEFRHSRTNHSPYIDIKDSQEFLVTKTPCILVQRTTSKEQNKRVQSAVTTDKFLNTFKNGFVVENHINIIKPTSKKLVSLKVLSALLNSDAIDQIFRCISGSVAVSAYELNALPLPDPEQIFMLEELVEKEDHSLINTFITQLYKQ